MYFIPSINISIQINEIFIWVEQKVKQTKTIFICYFTVSVHCFLYSICMIKEKILSQSDIFI